jgi:RNA polymerase sigma-54 factor
MSQYLSQHLGQNMRMEQRLTPRLIQSMAVLQKPVADLEAYVEEALESNAALELAEPKVETSTEPKNDDGVNGKASEEAADGFARAERFSRENDPDWQDRPAYTNRRVSSTGEPDAKMGAMANTAGREMSLTEHLRNQWSLVDVDDELRAAGDAVIDKLDPDGYLRTDLFEVARSARPQVSEEAVERVRPWIQKLDPIGVASLDTKECLLLQLDALTGDNSIERVLIERHLEDITHNRLPAVAKATGFSLGEINEAIKAMGTTLHLQPGHLVGDRSVPPIRPDVIVDYANSGGGLEVRLTRGNMPNLRVREDVVALAKTKGNGKEDRDFARKHVEEAAALIDAVSFRRTRLLQVARMLVEKQRDFFDVGPAGLKVCKMSDLADELECDPSTISRTVAEKYIQTPRGILPMRYFFTGGTETEDGEAVGWDHVKTRVKELIDEEPKTKPLNDDQIAARLEKEGIELSRRTVAKYRQQMNIPAARQRKQF